ncbi:hypothetical protein GCM10008956_38570 [Deinococcus arenae]|uniref:Uncharacterized protein n=1 Tax=Deinococcus arenae TaxID=1452751 RepID=A0A8H9GVX3_9DEIO|nr:hypothetical protein GCM10008956_38570 [Deinococcus arenae]
MLSTSTRCTPGTAGVRRRVASMGAGRVPGATGCTWPGAVTGGMGAGRTDGVGDLWAGAVWASAAPPRAAHSSKCLMAAG